MIDYINNIMDYQEPNTYELVANGLAFTLFTLLPFITIYICGEYCIPINTSKQYSPIEENNSIEPVVATPVEHSSLIEPVVATPIEDHHFTPTLMFPSPPFIIPQPTAPHFITPALMLPPPP